MMYCYFVSCALVGKLLLLLCKQIIIICFKSHHKTCGCKCKPFYEVQNKQQRIRSYTGYKEHNKDYCSHSNTRTLQQQSLDKTQEL